MLVVCCSLFVIVYCLCCVLCSPFLPSRLKERGGLGGHLEDASTLPATSTKDELSRKG